MNSDRTDSIGVLFSIPWCCVLPAALSFLSLGGAAAARMAVGSLLLPLFGLSIGFLAYGHYRAWILRQGRRSAKVILLVNTVLVAAMWVWRLPF